RGADVDGGHGRGHAESAAHHRTQPDARRGTPGRRHGRRPRRGGADVPAQLKVRQSGLVLRRRLVLLFVVEPGWPTLGAPSMSPKLSETAARHADAADVRYHLAAGLRRQINKVFPTHWSFLLGEIALYSFIVLLITVVYLTLVFDPSMTEVTYNGVYQPLRGVAMSRAYESALNISFEVRGGLFVRQIHHWAALMFAAAIMVHLARIFFTGAFRRPRETNWIIGSLLLILAMFEGYFGYSLPDDLLSGIGLRAALSSITLGMPVIGTWLHWALFGGDFPGTTLIPRLYALHILLIPGIILALIALHLALVWFQKHSQFPGPGRTEDNVVGVRVMPVFAVKS